tara:strand:- start:489 stop:755 length:267 start_codon:yes stop_codon:yes gene_type:complete
VYAFFLEFRERLSRSYEELFESSPEADLSREANFNVKYGWYHSIWRLANEDVTKLDEVTEMNFHKCLSALMYIKERNVVQGAKYKIKK